VRKILFVELVFCLVFLDVVLVSLLEILSGERLPFIKGAERSKKKKTRKKRQKKVKKESKEEGAERS
jgi:hypothetical protein